MTPGATEFPTATYRLQLHGHLSFAAARDLVPYLSELGIGAAYVSPFLCARQGSQHGYDVVDHGRLDPVLGTPAEFGEFAQQLGRHGMGLLVDIVPNHMGIDDPRNGWWQDVLENGSASTFSRFFDIDWNPPKVALQGKVLLPVLGDQFGKVLEGKELRLDYDDQRFVIRYYERSFPTDPVTTVPILKQALELVTPAMAADVPERMELESIVTSLEHLPPRENVDAETGPERYRENEVARRRLAALVETSGEIRAAIEQAIADYNGRRAIRPASTGSKLCWPTSPIDSATGASPPTKSTIGGSSTSTRWRRSASRIPRCSTRCTTPSWTSSRKAG